ncbi:Os08g0330900 [Oryza sativa Japonica Group]|uniref:Os08g0330900 protein n=2 Tax=Oryza sativa subsp. japonica TaxID=39947 RepID=Q0J6D9_ORYSJ|nr:Os08g0330900 [Oryza sativa Japonica Group]|eukprot:NP_001061562.1 Os08g0330900 [Oryza sativa Japonica Group]
MAAATSDHLSGLPDDVLRHIISLLSAKEGGATAVLSRRWRPLWRQAGTVNLDTEPYLDPAAYRGNNFPEHRRSAFVDHALAALAACESPRILSLRLASEEIEGGAAEEKCAGVVDAVQDAPAAARVEELRVRCDVSWFCRYGSCESGSSGGTWRLQLGSLPCAAATLRVLHANDVGVERLGDGGGVGVVLPLLEEMRLVEATVSPDTLQRVIDAAPRLANLWLDGIILTSNDGSRRLYLADGFRLQLRGPALTELALIEYYSRDAASSSTRPACAPSSFPGHYSLTSPAPDFASADLHFHDHRSYGDKDPNNLTVPLWSCLRHLHGVRVLKLQLDFYAEYITMEADACDGGGVVPATFPNLEYLELDAHCKDDHDMATELTVASVLRWCPAIRDLRLRLSVADAEGRVNVYNSKRHMIHQARLMRNSFEQDVQTKIDVDVTNITTSWINRLQGALSNEALGEFFQLWDEVRDVSLQQMADTIKWKLTADGNFLVASAYDLFFIATEDCSYGDTLWHSRVPSCVRFFMWIALKGRCLTADNLAKRNWPHDAICSLCQRENEDCHHLLVSCDYTAAVWRKLRRWCNINIAIPAEDGRPLADWWITTRWRFQNTSKKVKKEVHPSSQYIHEHNALNKARQGFPVELGGVDASKTKILRLAHSTPQETWNLVPAAQGIQNNQTYCSLKEWMSCIMQNESKTEARRKIWKARNDLKFQGLVKEPTQVCFAAEAMVQPF